ncbi:MAG: methyltransferase domain-containing protein, partial [Candidatus Omnitrophota bacterium]
MVEQRESFERAAGPIRTTGPPQAQKIKSRGIFSGILISFTLAFVLSLIIPSEWKHNPVSDWIKSIWPSPNKTSQGVGVQELKRIQTVKEGARLAEQSSREDANRLSNALSLTALKRICQSIESLEADLKAWMPRRLDNANLGDDRFKFFVDRANVLLNSAVLSLEDACKWPETDRSGVRGHLIRQAVQNLRMFVHPRGAIHNALSYLHATRQIGQGKDGQTTGARALRRAQELIAELDGESGARLSLTENLIDLESRIKLHFGRLRRARRSVTSHEVRFNENALFVLRRKVMPQIRSARQLFEGQLLDADRAKEAVACLERALAGFDKVIEGPQGQASEADRSVYAAWREDTDFVRYLFDYKYLGLITENAPARSVAFRNILRLLRKLDELLRQGLGEVTSNGGLDSAVDSADWNRTFEALLSSRRLIGMGVNVRFNHFYQKFLQAPFSLFGQTTNVAFVGKRLEVLFGRFRRVRGFLEKCPKNRLSVVLSEQIQSVAVEITDALKGVEVALIEDFERQEINYQLCLLETSRERLDSVINRQETWEDLSLRPVRDILLAQKRQIERFELAFLRPGKTPPSFNLDMGDVKMVGVRIDEARRMLTPSQDAQWSPETVEHDAVLDTLGQVSADVRALHRTWNKELASAPGDLGARAARQDPSAKPLDVRTFYTRQVRPGKTVFDLWNSADDVGAATVPSVYSLEYRSRMIDLLEREVGHRRDAPILNVGAGVGTIDRALTDKGYRNITSFDFMENAVAILNSKGLRAVLGDGRDMPMIVDGSQELVYMDGSLGHMADGFETISEHPFEKPLREACRVLAPGGILVQSDDPPESDLRHQINPRVHLLRIDEAFMRAELEYAGLEVKKVNYIPYERPGYGEVRRRVFIAQRAARPAGARLSDT